MADGKPTTPIMRMAMGASVAHAAGLLLSRGGWRTPFARRGGEERIGRGEPDAGTGGKTGCAP